MHSFDPGWPCCACGCGEPVPARKRTQAIYGFVKGEPCEFVHGHKGRRHLADGLLRCCVCELPKPVSEFPRDTNRRTGIDPRCKACQGQKLAEWWASPRGLGKARTYSSARRARKREQFVERVEARTLYARDDGLCGICGEAASFEDFHIDHIIPLSRGGEHSYANVQVAHSSCNSRKRDRILDDTASHSSTV